MATKENSTPTVVSLGTLTRQLKVTQRWIRDEAEAGRILGIRLTKTRWLFNQEAVEKVLAARAAEEVSND